MAPKTEVTRDDILPMDEFAKIRATKRAELVAIKKNRRIDVGPVATCYFENFDTMWWQIQEMLLIEKGGEEQIPGELDAYNPLVPNGRELVCTVMFEIDEPERRARLLAGLGGVEETMFLEFAGETVIGRPEADLDRTSAQGKASSVQFIHLPFTAQQAEKFKLPDTQVTVGFKHPKYAHMAIMPEAMRLALTGDLA
jgi:hypothetical protein